MGFDPTPFMANLFHFTYESKWVLWTKKNNLQKARKFTNTSHFLDDLCSINDNSEYGKKLQRNLPARIKIKKKKIHQN